MRIGDNVFRYPIAPCRLGVDEAIQKCALFRIINFVVEIPPFLVKEALTVGDEKLQIAGIGTIHIGIINLIDDAVAEREPDAATRMIGSANSFLGTARPARLDPRSAESEGIVGGVH